MNCIQPTASAELGPMLRPKFDSILLIAASTCHGIPYAAPARAQSACSSSYDSSRAGRNGASHTPGGSRIEPASFGISALGSATGPSGTTTKLSGLSGTTANVSADAVPTPSARASSAAAARRRITPPRGG